MAGKENSNRGRPSADGFVVQTVEFMIGTGWITVATSDIACAVELKRNAGDSNKVRNINEHALMELIHGANLPSIHAGNQVDMGGIVPTHPQLE